MTTSNGSLTTQVVLDAINIVVAFVLALLSVVKSAVVGVAPEEEEGEKEAEMVEKGDGEEEGTGL